MNNHAILTSERLIYRSYQIEDIRALVNLCNEKTYRRWFNFLPRLTEKTAKQQIENNIAMWSRTVNIMRDNCTLAVCKKDTGELIGSVGVSRYHGNKKLKNIEIAFDIGETYQRKGYATEAAMTMVRWGITQLTQIGEPPVIVGKAEHKNIASCRTLEKAGFTFVRRAFFCRVYEIK